MKEYQFSEYISSASGEIIDTTILLFIRDKELQTSKFSNILTLFTQMAALRHCAMTSSPPSQTASQLASLLADVVNAVSLDLANINKKCRLLLGLLVQCSKRKVHTRVELCGTKLSWTYLTCSWRITQTVKGKVKINEIFF